MPGFNTFTWLCVVVVFLTSSSSSSSSTSRMPESCSDSGLSPCPPVSVPVAAAADASFLLRRAIRALGCVETELSNERCSWAWNTTQKNTSESQMGQFQPLELSFVEVYLLFLNLLCLLLLFSENILQGQRRGSGTIKHRCSCPDICYSYILLTRQKKIKMHKQKGLSWKNMNLWLLPDSYFYGSSWKSLEIADGMEKNLPLLVPWKYPWKWPIKVIYQSTSEYTRGKRARQEGKDRKDEESMKPKTKRVKLVLRTWKRRRDSSHVWSVLFHSKP